MVGLDIDRVRTNALKGIRRAAWVVGAAAWLAGCQPPSPLDDTTLEDISSSSTAKTANGPGTDGPVASTATMSAATLPPDQQPPVADVARFLSQSTFGPVSPAEIMAVRAYGYDAWLQRQFTLDAASHLGYLIEQAPRSMDGKPTEEMSYEAIWQQWLYSEAQLRARVAFALSEIFVISNIAPDLDPRAMSSYMDMLNRNAFGNYRTLLEDVTLHPAMGYYLNLLESEKEDPVAGTHPNENYAREVLQLFSIGLVRLAADGTVIRDATGTAVPTYDQSVILGFAKAFSGWGFAGRNTASARAFHDGPENWTEPMQPWPSKHSTGSKLLLDGRVLPAGQTPQQDMKDALDTIFQHPNVGPFIGRRLIQRLVTSNPSPAYVGRVAAAFADNGAGVRGDLKATVRAVLMDSEARDLNRAATDTAGKQREPVIRFANLLRSLKAHAVNGRNDIHYLDSADNALGQSPLLAPSVFNFFSPDYRNPGPIAQAQLYSPEFQITNETTVVGTLNFFASVIGDAGYGSDDSRLKLEYGELEALSADATALVDRLDLLYMNGMASTVTRSVIARAVGAIPAASKRERVRTALLLTAIAPDFVIQR